MADSAALSTAAAASSSLPRSLASRRPLSSPLHARSRPLQRVRLGSRSLHRLRARAGKDNQEDLYGPYPWDQPLDLTTGFDIQWVPEDRVTLFTSDGLVQIGGSLVPRRVRSSEKRQRKLKSTQKLRRFQESSYMDPNQSLCLGALFNIAATNGLDMGRRLCIFGFCRSIEMLSDVVEDTVLEHGGEVVTAEKASNDGLQEKLTMSVAVPLLWGVPPASETLHVAVRSGGGGCLCKLFSVCHEFSLLVGEADAIFSGFKQYRDRLAGMCQSTRSGRAPACTLWRQSIYTCLGMSDDGRRPSSAQNQISSLFTCYHLRHVKCFA